MSMEVWVHHQVTILTHVMKMMARNSMKRTDEKSARSSIGACGEGRRWRVVWWRWKLGEPLHRERERENSLKALDCALSSLFVF